MDSKHNSEFSSKRIRLLVSFAGLLLAALGRVATAQQTVPVTANMVDGSNNPVPGAYLHYDLYNCGPNYPTLSSFTIPGTVSSGTFQPGEIVKQGTTNVTATLLSYSPFVVTGLSSRTADGSHTWVGQTSSAVFTPSGVPAGGQIIVQRSFDLQQNSSGLITGTVVPNDLIQCGNVFSTQWTVTPMKSGATPLNAAQRYFICSVAGSGTPPCAQTVAGAAFDPSTAQPSQVVPQPPGYSLVLANPVANQSIDQPAGTEFNWEGTVNFCSATVLCGGNGGGYELEVNGSLLSAGDTVNFNNSTPAAGSNGINVTFQTSRAGSTDSVSAELVGDGNASHFLNGQAGWTTPSGSGGGNPALDNCTPDESGNSFYSVISLTNYFYAGWQFIFNTTTYINCTVYIPTAQSGATIVLDIATSDNTAGHTASFQTCDGVINSGTINLASSLTCASGQTFTTTSTAYNRVTLTFNVQSTLSNGSMLAVKIGVSPSGTAPTANLLVYPHFVL